jgi:Zn-dependent protease
MTDIRRARPPASPGQQALGMVIATLVSLIFLGVWAGWMWAFGAVVGIFVHEYGHVLAMNALGCGPAKMRIVPFLGGAATPARPPATEFNDVLISLAGPSFGLLAVLPFYALASLTQNPMWLGAAIAVAIINLLNLIPAPPLDGSRALGPALARIHPQLERAVVVVVGGVAILWCGRSGNWLIGAFIAISVLSLLKRASIRPFALRLTTGQLLISVLLYLATVALCVAALGLTLHIRGATTGPLELLQRLAGIV